MNIISISMLKYIDENHYDDQPRAPYSASAAAPGPAFSRSRSSESAKHP